MYLFATAHPQLPSWLQSFAGQEALELPESSRYLTLPCFLFLGKVVLRMKYIDHFSINDLCPQIQALLGKTDVQGHRPVTGTVVS